MKYSEATKLIKGLSKKYSINNYESFYSVVYNGLEVLRVYKEKQYFFGNMIKSYYFDKLPYSHKLWMIIAELAMTPLNERKEHQWNVIITHNPNNGKYSYTAWFKTHNGYDIFDSFSKQKLTVSETTRFTDKEFAGLIKYLKSLPDGEFQAKVAEHGKTKVNKE